MAPAAANTNENCEHDREGNISDLKPSSRGLNYGKMLLM